MNEEKSYFQPLELNESVVNQMFYYCLAKDGEPFITACLFYHQLGYTMEEEQILHFNEDKINLYRKSIQYILGQLKIKHTPLIQAPVVTYNRNYMNKPWTMDKACLLEMLYLGNSILYFSGVEKDTNNVWLIDDDLPSTISPNDPRFPKWWEEHKAEWED